MGISLGRKLKSADGSVIEPGALYQAIDSFTGAAGTVRQGARLRGADPAVVASPGLFISAACSDAELFAAANRYRQAASPPPEPDRPVSSDGVALRTAQPITSPDGFLVAVEGIGPVHTNGHSYAPIPAGTLVSVDSIVAKSRPKSFRPATVADLPAAQ